MRYSFDDMPRYRHEDLICPDGHRDRRLVGDDEPRPVCSCGKPMHLLEDDEVIDDTRHVQVFKPFTYEGTFYSTEVEWKAHVAGVAKNLQVPEDHLVLNPVDRKADKVRAEEAKHRGWLGRKASGGEEVYREKVAEHRRKTGKDAKIVVGYRGTR